MEGKITETTRVRNDPIRAMRGAKNGREVAIKRVLPPRPVRSKRDWKGLVDESIPSH